MKLSTALFECFDFRPFIVAVSLSVAACSEGVGKSEPSQSVTGLDQVVSTSEVVSNLANDGTWMLEDKLFVSGGEGFRTQSTSAGHVTIVIGDEVFDNSNGVYSGGSISIFLTETGSGVYTVSDSVNTVASVGNGTKVASITVTAGTLSNNATQWATTATSGTVSVTVNLEGRYFVTTTEPLILTRKLDVGTGIPGSPNQVSFSMRNINGVIIQ